jgi:hypothetical protein
LLLWPLGSHYLFSFAKCEHSSVPPSPAAPVPPGKQSPLPPSPRKLPCSSVELSAKPSTYPLRCMGMGKPETWKQLTAIL